VTPDIDNAAKWREVLARPHLSKLALLSLALWLHAANSMLTATTLPSAVEEIGGIHLMSWAFALYLMGSIVAAASIGLVVTTFGLRATMRHAATVYGLGCIICAVAPLMSILLLGRTLQGLGGGGLVALVYIAQTRFFPNHFIPKIVGCLSVVWMTSSFFGPVIGGAFATWGVWRLAFWVFAVQAALLIIAIHFLLKKPQSALNVQAEKIPTIRLLTLALSIISISMAGAQFEIFRSSLFIVFGCVAMALFLIRDKRATTGRMLPVETTNLDHEIGNGIAMTFAFCLSIMSFLVYGPLILIRLYDLTPLHAGLVVMVETLGWSIAAILFSGISPSNDKKLIRVGGLLVLAGLVCQALFLPSGPLWAVIVSAIIGNSGFGMMWGFIIRRITNAAHRSDKDRTASLLPTAQQLGFALGAALCGLIANGLGVSEDMPVGEMRRVAFWVFAGFVPMSLIGNLFAWRFTSRQPL